MILELIFEISHLHYSTILLADIGCSDVYFSEIGFYDLFVFSYSVFDFSMRLNRN